MKTLKLFIILFVAALLPACNTSEEHYFQGKWEAIEYFVNAEDQLTIHQIFLNLSKEGEFEQIIITQNQERRDEGTWEFDKTNQTFRMIYQRNGQTVTWNVLSQSKNQFHMNNQEYAGFYVEWKFKRID